MTRRWQRRARCRWRPAAVEWIVSAAGAGVVGLVIGGALIPLVGYVVAPAWKAVKRRGAEAEAGVSEGPPERHCERSEAIQPRAGRRAE